MPFLSSLYVFAHSLTMFPLTPALSHKGARGAWNGIASPLMGEDEGEGESGQAPVPALHSKDNHRGLSLHAVNE